LGHAKNYVNFITKSEKNVFEGDSMQFIHFLYLQYVPNDIKN